MNGDHVMWCRLELNVLVMHCSRQPHLLSHSFLTASRNRNVRSAEKQKAEIIHRPSSSDLDGARNFSQISYCPKINYQDVLGLGFD